MGGKATLKTGESSSNIELYKFNMDLYESFKKNVIGLINKFNVAYKKFSNEPLWKKQSIIDNFEIFSGSGYSFLTHTKNDFVTVKPTMGDLDVQVPEKCRELLKSFLEKSIGKKFNGFTYLGTKCGLDFYNIFKAPSKYHPFATNIQIDFEFNDFDSDGNPNEFDLWSKNSDWSDLKIGIKGVAKQELLTCVYKIKYKRIGVLLQPTKNIPAKNQRGGNFNTLSLGPKGSRNHYVPVMEHGKQLIVDGKLAFRETSLKNTGSNKNLDSIFEEIFDHKPNEIEKKQFWSYQGCLQLIKDNFNKTFVNEIFQLYKKHMLDHIDSEKNYNTIINKFKEFME